MSAEDSLKKLEERLTRLETALAQQQPTGPGGFTPPGGAVVDPAPFPGYGRWGYYRWPHPVVDPYSSFRSIRQNVDFLEAFIGDGWTVAPFCRMLPYAGTPIQRRLEAEGRLLGTQFEPDYKFLDAKLDLFYDWMVNTFYTRNFTNQGLCHILRSLLFEAHLRLPARNRVSESQKEYLHYLTAVCNRVACYTLRSAVDHIESTPLARLESDPGWLEGLTEHERREEARLTAEVEQYYEWVHQDHSPIPGPVGGFEKSWTFNAGDYEAAGVGAAMR